MLLLYQTGISPGNFWGMTVCLSEGSSALALPCSELSPVAGGCLGSGPTDVGPRAVLRCSAALFPQPSSLLFSFGLLALVSPSKFPPWSGVVLAAFPCPAALRLPPCSVPLLTPLHFVPSCATPFSPQLAGFLAFPLDDDGWRSRKERVWRGRACPACPGFVMCGGVQLQG